MTEHFNPMVVCEICDGSFRLSQGHTLDQCHRSLADSKEGQRIERIQKERQRKRTLAWMTPLIIFAVLVSASLAFAVLR